ncbi:MAG: PhoX family phosphatase [Ignavibacteria bacterium]|nr:PhoX family phosphatase [Ignavibacteria bacterium]
MKSRLEVLINRKISRRKMLKDAGKASAFLAVSSVLPSEFFNIPFLKEKINNSSDIFFKPIVPSDEDKFIIPEGFSYNVIRKWGDRISASEDFGYNNDYTAYLPIDFLEGGNNSEDGLLVVNHEFPSPLFINGYTDDDFRNNRIKTKEEVDAEKRSVGISVFRVKKVNGEWRFAEDDKFNRRIDALTPVKLCGKAAGSEELKFSEYSAGTIANCSGGITPWGTLLSGEENFQDYFTSENLWEYRWNDADKDFIVENYGWVVELDPFDKNSEPKKRTSLGRFRHENVAVNISADNKVVAYMGDDKINECVYKFISEKNYDKTNRENNFDILDKGDLYVADFENNKWQLIDFEKREELKKNFRSQADVLINCDKAAKFVGGTECNRPEDIEINPVDNSVFIAFTNNSKKKDNFGSIVRIIERNNDSESLEFEWEVFATGGTASGFSCPDNLTFDSKGNLWVLCDISNSKLNKDIYKSFKNNSLFMIPTSGENKGKAFQFASGPADCEMCGGNFTPDESTMFLAVQHPGENTVSLDKPTSRWPDYGSDIPRPAVIAITGFKK